jgi:LysR family hydrogen peroxide-inducible transcriptional activator
MLSQDKLDIAFLALPFDDFGTESTPYLEKIPLFFDKFYLAVSINHPFSTEKMIATHNITSKELLLLEEGHCLRTQALEFCQITDKNLKIQTDFRGSSLETLLSMVRMGTGYTLIPEIALNTYRPDISFVPLQDAKIGRHIYMIFNTNILSHDIIDKCKEFLNVFA